MFIVAYVIVTGKLDKDCVVDDDGYDSDEEDEGGLENERVITDFSAEKQKRRWSFSRLLMTLLF